jgi:hypothetical protein
MRSRQTRPAPGDRTVALCGTAVDPRMRRTLIGTTVRSGAPTAVTLHRERIAAGPAPVAQLPSIAVPSNDVELPGTPDTRNDPPGAEVKVPATPATLSQWVSTWMRMCADGDLVLGPLNDDEHARRQYDLSAKQLRNIRNAATSAALRRRADELGVPLPAGYLDRPTGIRINGQALTGTAA